MQTLKFETTINAAANKVWHALWDDKNYREWTIPFGEGSHAESDWEEGSSIKFLDPSGDGMYSIIEKKVENQRMTFKHLGMVKDGKQIPNTDWTNAVEDYILQEKNGKTTLKVSVDTVEKYKDMFNNSFNEALKIIKKLSEK